ncbi:MAG TPA: DNA polymerase III subunit beta [Urbifossiella sp.]|nr:DNA polymerase III subunit beta [Urbifossiella sp.]
MPKAGTKFECRRTDLLAACQLANLVVLASQHQPVLRNIKLDADETRCRIEATNQEYGIRLDVTGVTVSTGGRLLIPADRLTAILRETSDETVTIEATDRTTLVRTGQSEFELNTEDPATYPEVPTPRPKQHHAIIAGQLRNAVHRTRFAAAKESDRYPLTGTLWELDESEIRLVATDGKRLAFARCDAKAHGGNEPPGPPHIVPAKAMQLLERLLTDPEEVVKVTLNENEAFFRVGTAVLHTRLIEGRYPSYRDIFPKTKAVEIPLPVGPFHSVIRQAAILADSDSLGVEFSFTTRTLTLHTRSPDAGRSKVELTVEFSGEPITVALEPRFVADVLRTLSDDQTLTLELTDSKKAVVFRLGTAYAYLIMPLC